MAEHIPKLAEWEVGAFKLADYNPRKISRERFEDLKRSIKADPDFLRVRPIIVNVNPERHGIVIGGHMRLLAAKDLGFLTVPVIEVWATPKQERAWNLKDNSHHGEWDRAKLAEMIIPEPIAFEHAVPTDLLDGILSEYGSVPEAPSNVEDRVDDVAAAETHVTKPGDRWDLGDHVLVCGDSTSPATFEHLLAGEKAGMCFTDPPYNVDYGGSMRDAMRGNARKIANDKLEAEEWVAFVRAFLGNIARTTAGAVYVCMSTKEWPSLQSAFIEAGMRWSDTIIWVKDVFTLGRADYQRQYEPIMKGRPVKESKAGAIMYGWPSGINRKWNGGRDEADAWFFRRPKTSPVHPTQKPVELVARAIMNSSNRGDTVLDCFAGGGSTLIACERTGRRARLIELSPGYCDAIVARYVGHTKDAKLTLNGQPHDWTGPVITIEGVLDSLG